MELAPTTLPPTCIRPYTSDDHISVRLAGAIYPGSVTGTSRAVESVYTGLIGGVGTAPPVLTALVRWL